MIFKLSLIIFFLNFPNLNYKEKNIVLDYEYSIPNFIEGFYFADKNIQTTKNYEIKALIVPHHLTATKTIAAGFKMLAEQKFQEMIIISPDHFSTCEQFICTTDKNFEIFLGKIFISKKNLNVLKNFDFVKINNDIFYKEHGIHALLPYIKNYFPKIKITPLVLSQHKKYKKEKALNLLKKLFSKNSMLVISSDFSHYLNFFEANKRDQETMEKIFSKDFFGILKLNNPQNSDCPLCLWLISQIADENNFYNPSVIMHSNSAEILNDKNSSNTTSHFAITYYKNFSLGDDLVFAGDVSFTRKKQREINLGPKTSDFWEKNKTRVVNLEGPVLENCKTSKNPYIFCNEKNFFEKKSHLATHWNTVNNHMYDFYDYKKTPKNIIKLGKIPLVKNKFFEDEKIKIFSFTAVLNPINGNFHHNIDENYDQIIQNLKNKNNKKLNIIYIHYGEEFRVLPSDYDFGLLKNFIDAGADAVIGHHNHVIGGIYIYKEKPIFTSLGNFIFDQTKKFSTKNSMLVKIRKNKDKVEFETWIGDPME